jgi:hypothetical protein
MTSTACSPSCAPALALRAPERASRDPGWPGLGGTDPPRQHTARRTDAARAAAVRRTLLLGMTGAPGHPSSESCWWGQDCGTPLFVGASRTSYVQSQTEAQALCEIAHLGIGLFRFLPPSGLRRERPTKAARSHEETFRGAPDGVPHPPFQARSGSSQSMPELARPLPDLEALAASRAS